MKMFRRFVAAICAALCLTSVVSPTASGFVSVNAMEKVKEIGLPKVKIPTPTNSGYIEAYTTKTSGRVNSFDSTGWIDAAADRCRIVGFNSDGSLRISFPTSSGRLTRNFKANCFTSADLKNGSFDSYRVTKNFQCYRRIDKKNTFGSAYKNDIVYLVATSGSMIQIIYPLTGTNNYRMCWTPKSNMSYMVKLVSKVDFVNEQKASWFKSAENTISNLSNNSAVITQAFATTEFLTKICNVLGSTVTANPLLMLKSVANPSSCFTTFAGLVLVTNVVGSCDEAIRRANKVLAWKNKTITNSNWQSFVEDVREMQAYSAYARAASMAWLDELASLNTPAKRAQYLFNLCGSGILDGVFGALGDADISKTLTKVVNGVNASTTALQCLNNTAALFGGTAYKNMTDVRNTFNNMIANIKKLA